MAAGETIGFREEPAAMRGWWEQRYTLIVLVVLSAVPLLWPDIPALVDLPGHMGRYRVQLDIDQSPALASYYAFEWSLIGNLGFDLLVVPLSELFGLEPAVKLIVLAIPPLTVLGFLWVAREVHGRMPPTAFFAVPLAYNFPLLFGFVNFALSMALAFLAFALWLRLARTGHLRLRAAIFIPISLIIWVTHAFGWGTLGVMAFSAELVRQHDRRQSLPRAILAAALHCLPLAPPFVLMLIWRSGHGVGMTGDWFNLKVKLAWLIMALRDRWMPFDIAALAIIVATIGVGLGGKRLGFSRNLAVSATFLALIFLLLPRIIFGSAYADMRLIPYVLAVAVIAIRPREGAGFQFRNAVALAGLAFILVRTGGTTISFWMFDRDYDRHLAALDRVERDARIVFLVRRPCASEWYHPRLDHLGAMATVRRGAFVNDQWDVAGAELMHPIGGLGTPYNADPSQFVDEAGACSANPRASLQEHIDAVPRDRFDYVWIAGFDTAQLPAFPGLARLYADERTALFRVAARPAGQVAAARAYGD